MIAAPTLGRDWGRGGQHHVALVAFGGAQTITLAAVMLYRLIT